MLTSILCAWKGWAKWGKNSPKFTVFFTLAFLQNPAFKKLFSGFKVRFWCIFFLYHLDWTSESCCCLLLISFLNWGAAFLSIGDCHRLQQLWHCIWCFCWTGPFKIVHFFSTNSAIKSWLGYLIWASALLGKPSINKKSQRYGHFPYPCREAFLL